VASAQKSHLYFMNRTVIASEDGFLASRLSFPCFSLLHILCLVSCTCSVKEFS
jgi:hypothetical protein